MMNGRLFGLGIGPGDPELITLKAYRILQSSDLLVYPAPEQGDSLARTIAAPHVPDGIPEYVMRMPLNADRFPAQRVYDAAASRISSALRDGKQIAVLCEGDPFFYGSFMYLFERLASDHPVEVVPGVSSLMACAATSCLPLAARNDVLTVLPATLSDAALEARLSTTDAAAIIKVGRHLPRLVVLLERLGLAECARYIEHATMTGQKVLSLRAAAGLIAPYFSMILLHQRGQAWR